jgi:hypothetical protein
MNGTPVSLQPGQEHRHVDVKDIPGTPQIWRIFLPKDSKDAVGQAIVVQEEGEALLLHIEVREDLRRRKLATSLIEAMKTKFDSIVTGHSTKEGRELCLACGFEWEGGVFKNRPKMLVWRKPNEEEKGAENDEKPDKPA